MNHILPLLLWTIVATQAAPGRCDDETKPSKGDKLAAQRLKIMREAIDGFRITSKEIDADSSLKFSARPLLRYNDQTRNSGSGIKGVLDATVWRLGESGRPKAIVTLEIYLVNQGNPLLTYEFVSLTPEKFEMQSLRGVRWMPHDTDLLMTEFDEAPQPGDSPRARLVQMRELARRFAVQEMLGAEKIDLRLLSQPLDRYDDPAAGILDGALFVFANGTNPEVGLLLECSEKNEKKWSYGLFRLAAAKLLAQLDGKWILQSTKPPGWPIDAPYTATRHAVALPEEDEGE
ncbi:MAG TPA: hypothetical protein VMV10_00610 [Pirellulales bacterium]|nr:hypothetical protein [Pirellulales bacterium]